MLGVECSLIKFRVRRTFRCKSRISGKYRGPFEAESQAWDFGYWCFRNFLFRTTSAICHFV